MDDLVVDHRLTIPGVELHESFSTSGGPGGQHANRSATRVTLAWAVTSSAIDPAVRFRLVKALDARLESGELRVTVDESRSQWRNRQLARQRMVQVVREALKPPARKRVATRPSRARRQARLDEKRRRSETKRLRGRPAGDD